jgi:ribose transport system substrate-binding protein
MIFRGGIVPDMQLSRRSVLAGVVVAALGGCASGKGEQAASGPREVIYVSGSNTGPFFLQIADGFRFGGGLVPGVTATVTGPKSRATDTVEQMKIISDVVAKGAASVAISAPFSEINTDPIDQAAAKGVRLLAIDTPPLPGSVVETYVGNDNHGLGQLLADTVISELGASAVGKIVMGSPRNGVPQLDARASGFRERLKEKAPGLKAIGPLDTAEIPTVAIANWMNVIRANKDAVAFASVGANSALLAGLRAKQKATWLAASFDIDPEALAAVKRGGLVVVSPEQFLKGAVAGKLQAQYLGQEAKLPAGWLEIPGVAITSKNVDEYIARDATAESKKAWYTTHLDQFLGAGGPHMRPLEESQQ